MWMRSARSFLHDLTRSTHARVVGGQLLSAARRLRELLSRAEPVLAPGAYDALTAKIVEWAGFEAVYMTGFGVAASVLGKPDLGLISLTEAATHAGNMAKAVTIPLIADADVGFGGPLNVVRTVEQFETRGVAGIHIEDQESPKRSAYVDGVGILSRDEYVGKIKAAIQARTDPDFVIIARTDAYVTLGFSEVVDRVNACADVGADIIFITGEAHMTESERERLAEVVRAPRFGTVVSPLALPAGAPASNMHKIVDATPYKLLVMPIESLLVATKAVMDYLREFKETCDLVPLSDRLLSFDDFDRFIGLSATIREAEESFGAPRREVGQHEGR
jgi:2-methylisocitrate lyase-like PEP mutase family enzyme